ncbi:hypothetical protein E4U17_001007, partial [Claviceps sp. LM77 group G4]
MPKKGYGEPTRRSRRLGAQSLERSIKHEEVDEATLGASLPESSESSAPSQLSLPHPSTQSQKSQSLASILISTTQLPIEYQNPCRDRGEPNLEERPFFETGGPRWPCEAM